MTVLETILSEKELIKAVQAELELISGVKADYFNPDFALGFVIACPDFYREGLK